MSDRVYFIGHRDLGILIVHDGIKRLKVDKISKQVIDAYAAKQGVLADQIFGDLARILSFVSTAVNARSRVDFTKPKEVDTARTIGRATAANVLGGLKVSSADFCFVTEVPDSDFAVGRFSAETDPIANIMKAFDSGVSGNLGPIQSSDFD